MQFLYNALSLNELRALYMLLPPAHLYTVINAFSTPQRSIQPGYTLQGTTGDQCTIAFSAYCQVLILPPREPKHISGTNLAQGLAQVPKTKCMEELEPMISWLRVQCLNHSVNDPPYTLERCSLVHSWHFLPNCFPFLACPEMMAPVGGVL